MKAIDAIKKINDSLKDAGCKPQMKTFSKPIKLGNNWNGDMTYRTMQELIVDVKNLVNAGRSINDQDIDNAIKSLISELK